MAYKGGGGRKPETKVGYTFTKFTKSDWTHHLRHVRPAACPEAEVPAFLADLAGLMADITKVGAAGNESAQVTVELVYALVTQINKMKEGG